MKYSLSKKWFTLIELLVVITIIGILATGAVSVYTSQIQKARDSTRTTDIKAVQAWVEQFYGDNGEYPSEVSWGKSFSGVTAYVQTPSDPKSGQARSWSAFDYLYNSDADANNIPYQEYEISATYEQSANTTEKSAKDGWDDDNRMELWINLGDTGHSTKVTAAIALSVVKFSCVPAGGWSSSTTCSGTAPMLIRK
jgi:type II secretion system protein G